MLFLLLDGFGGELLERGGHNINVPSLEEDKIVAPMPGKVVKIPVRKGDRLSSGDIVVVLEAMKMQSNYKVTSDCTVRDILVNEGDSVNANQVLIVLDIIKED